MGAHTSPHTTPSPSPVDTNELLAAFTAVQPEAAALDLASQPRYTLDAVYAVSIFHRAQAATAFLAPEFAQLCPFNHRPLEQLPTYARALLHANGLVASHAALPSVFDAQVTEARAVRNVLLTSADLLVKRGRLSAAAVARIREGQGLRDLVEDLTALRLLLASFAGGVVESAELEQAASLSASLTEGLQVHNHDPALGPLLEQRRRVAGLFLGAYAQLQRAVNFLRFDQGDSRKLVPSVYVPGVRPTNSDSADEAPTTPETPAAPVTTPRSPLPEEPSDRPFSTK